MEMLMRATYSRRRKNGRQEEVDEKYQKNVGMHYTKAIKNENQQLRARGGETKKRSKNV